MENNRFILRESYLLIVSGFKSKINTRFTRILTIEAEKVYFDLLYKIKYVNLHNHFIK